MPWGARWKWKRRQESLDDVMFERLASALQSGDQKTAASVLCTALAGETLRFFRNAGLSPDAAEDLTQRQFLVVVQRLGELREPRSVRAWFDRIRTNVLRDHLRARRRQREVPSPDVDTALAPEDEEAVWEDMRVTYHRHRALLSSQQQEVLDARERGLKFREIAVQLGIGEEAAKKTFQRGVAVLRNAIDEEENSR